MEMELSEFFGATVLIQLREAVLLAKPGPTRPYLQVMPWGEPKVISQNNELRPVGREQIVPEMPDAQVYTLVIQGRILPGSAGRVFVLYEVEGHIAKMSLRPSDIYAVTWIEGKLEDKSQGRIIASS